MTTQSNIKRAFERNAKAMKLRPALAQATGITKVRIEQGLRCVIEDGPWKLVVGEKGAQDPALFHLDDDLGEKTDLATAQSQRVGRMLAELDAWHSEVLTGATLQPEKADE